MRVGVLDLGSSSFQIQVAEVGGPGAVQLLGRAKRVVGLGEATFGRGRLDGEAVDKAVLAVRELLDEGRPHRPERLVAVGTSAIREAPNAVALLDALADRLGLEVEVLGGAEEARLCYRGARHSLPQVPGCAVVADVGGGSVEIAVGHPDRCRWAASFPLGALRMSSGHRTPGGITGFRDVERITAEVRRVVGAVTKTIRGFEPEALVFSGGTPRRVAALAGIAEPQHRVERSTFVDIAGQLVDLDVMEIVDRGVSPARAPTIAPGAVVVATLMMVLGFKAASIARHGLRLGVLLREAERLGGAAVEVVRGG